MTTSQIDLRPPRVNSPNSPAGEFEGPPISRRGEFGEFVLKSLMVLQTPRRGPWTRKNMRKNDEVINLVN